MADAPLSPDIDRELRELRARAYGPHPDIFDDPSALARLAELQAKQASSGPAAPEGEDSTGGILDAPGIAEAREPPPDAESPSGSPPGGVPLISSWRRAASSRSGRFGLAAAAGLAILAGAYGVTWLLGPHPDATLWSTASAPDPPPFLSLLDGNLDAVDSSTFESYDVFRGLEPWTVTDNLGRPCLVLFQPSTNLIIDARCTPRRADLIVDVGAWPSANDAFAEGLPAGSLIRFRHHGNTVDVFVHPADPVTDLETGIP